MPRYEYRYRPYLVGEAPDFEHLDHREPGWRLAGRRFSYLFNALLQAGRSTAEPEPPPDAKRPKSSFYDFDERDFARLEAVLERLAAATARRPTALVLIPTERDLDRRAISGPDPLSARLLPAARRLDVRVVNLLQALADRSTDARAYFLPCDYHWSRRANRIAASIVLDELAAMYASLRSGE